MPFPALLLPLLLSAGPAKLAAMDIRPRDGVTPGLAQIITDAVVVELRRRARGITIIASEDLRNLVGFETEKKKLGCQETACLAEVGGALGVDQIVVGSLAKLGEAYILDLRLIDARHAKVVVEANERLLSKRDEALLDAAARAVATLFPATAGLSPGLQPGSEASVSLTDTQFHPRPLAIALGSLGVAAGVFAVISLVEVLSFEKGDNRTVPIPLPQATDNVNTTNTWATVGLVTGIAAAAGIGGAVITW